MQLEIPSLLITDDDEDLRETLRAGAGATRFPRFGGLRR